jgi:hypothetical protein
MDHAERESQSAAVSLSVGYKLVGRRDVNVFCSAVCKLVVDESVDLSAFSDTCAIAIPMTLSHSVREDHVRRLASVDYVLDLEV